MSGADVVSTSNAVSSSDAPLPVVPARRPEIDELRLALAHMSGAERRLRGRDHSRPGELTYAQVRSLAALGREGEMTAGQLARSAELNPATVTALLDHLEEAKIVQRRRGTEDRRQCLVSLTPSGWEILERKLASWQSRWEEKLADISARDLQAAARVIAQVTDLYEEISQKLDGADAPDGQ
ncbi:MAG: MarR family winged helix-turn-helix transcriptional regulator [Solirubrobacteraceae bacterium]